MKHTRILILDDSIMAREALQLELERDVNIKVVAKAASAYEARDKIVEHEPDILIADVNLGGMSGIEFVRKLLPQYYLPVIVISSNRNLADIAKSAMAVDFIPKPSGGGPEEMSLFAMTLIARIKAIVYGASKLPDIPLLSDSMIAIGASTGGVEAIKTIITSLPCVMPAIVIAQHMPGKFTRSFADQLNATSQLSVKEAEDGDMLIPGQVYVAPGGMHTCVASNKFRRQLNITPNANHSSLCPSVDMLFTSVSKLNFTRSIGVILTGMGKDGAAGLKLMHANGSHTIGQDEDSSVVYGMPKIAYEDGSVDYRLPLNEIAAKIQALLAIK